MERGAGNAMQRGPHYVLRLLAACLALNRANSCSFLRSFVSSAFDLSAMRGRDADSDRAFHYELSEKDADSSGLDSYGLETAAKRLSFAHSTGGRKCREKSPAFARPGILLNMHIYFHAEAACKFIPRREICCLCSRILFCH